MCNITRQNLTVFLSVTKMLLNLNFLFRYDECVIDLHLHVELYRSDSFKIRLIYMKIGLN